MNQWFDSRFNDEVNNTWFVKFVDEVAPEVVLWLRSQTFKDLSSDSLQLWSVFKTFLLLKRGT